MKRKKTVPAEVVPKPVNDAAPVPEKDHPLYDRLFVVGFAVLLFFAMTVQTVPMSLILAAVALALSFGMGGLCTVSRPPGNPGPGVSGLFDPLRGRQPVYELRCLRLRRICQAAGIRSPGPAVVGTRTGTERRRTPVRLLCRVRSDRASMYRCRVPGTALSRLCLFYGGAWGCSLSEPGSSDLYGRPV